MDRTRILIVEVIELTKLTITKPDPSGALNSAAKLDQNCCPKVNELLNFEV
jgi:hypothetical protein